VLEITEHGVFQGTIAVDNAEVHGRFEGELTVRKQLVIHSTGRVSGKTTAVVVGALVSLVLGALVECYAPFLLPITAGTFIYVAGSDLIPELHHHHSRPAIKSLWQFMMIVLGIGLMLVPLFFEHGH
jgi:hypothetical protein